jgi:hypothetical protein
MVDLAIKDIATLFFDVLAREKDYLLPSISMQITGQKLTPYPENNSYLNYIRQMVSLPQGRLSTRRDKYATR